MTNKKKLKREYKQQPPLMGVFLIRNSINHRVLVGAGLNLEGVLNRHRFQLEKGIHPNTELQKEWDHFGSDKFAFEIVDQLDPLAIPKENHKADLESLSNLWLEKLQPFGEKGYNEPKLSREAMLRRIAAKRVID